MASCETITGGTNWPPMTTADNSSSANESQGRLVPVPSPLRLAAAAAYTVAGDPNKLATVRCRPAAPVSPDTPDTPRTEVRGQR